MWKQQLGLGFASAGIVIITQSTIAQAREISGVRLNSAEEGLAVILDTTSDESPQFFKTEYGKTLIIDIINTQLR